MTPSRAARSRRGARRPIPGPEWKPIAMPRERRVQGARDRRAGRARELVPRQARRSCEHDAHRARRCSTSRARPRRSTRSATAHAGLVARALAGASRPAQGDRASARRRHVLARNAAVARCASGAARCGEAVRCGGGPAAASRDGCRCVGDVRAPAHRRAARRAERDHARSGGAGSESRRRVRRWGARLPVEPTEPSEPLPAVDAGVPTGGVLL